MAITKRTHVVPALIVDRRFHLNPHVERRTDDHSEFLRLGGDQRWSCEDTLRVHTGRNDKAGR